MRKMAQSLGFTAGGQSFDVSSQRIDSKPNCLRTGHTFGSFEQASIHLKNETAYDNNESGQGGLFCDNNQQVHDSIYMSASQRSTSLDPLEEKSLFDMDDNPWDTSSGKCVKADTGNVLGHTDNSVTFPSFHCGSWSALMQSTLAETSNCDAVVQETWSDFTFQNAVLMADSQSVTPVNLSSIPQQRIFQCQQVSGVDDESQPLQTAWHSEATDSVSQHYSDSDALPILQPATQWTDVPLQNNSAGGESEMLQGSDSTSKDVERILESFQNHNKQESENVTPTASTISGLKNTSSEVLDADGPLTSEIQNLMEIIGGCSLKNTSMNQKNASVLPVNMVADMTDYQSLAISRPNKRKSPASELLPWHKEMIRMSVLLPDKRTDKREWGQATNRQIETEIDVELCKPEHSVNRPRKRLILTTRFMHKLLPLTPGTVLSNSAASSYEGIIYIVARLLLADACSMSTTCDKANCTDKIDMEENKKINRLLQSYSIRIKQLEDNLQRFDSRP